MKTIGGLALAIILGLSSLAHAQEVYRHPLFALDLAPEFSVRKDKETANSGFVLQPVFLSVKLGCTITVAPLQGNPANPATWSLPDRVIADPSVFFSKNGTIQKILAIEKYTGRNGFPSIRVAAERMVPGEAEAKVYISTHTLLDAQTQGIISCVQGNVPRINVSDADIAAALTMTASLRKP